MSRSYPLFQNALNRQSFSNFFNIARFGPDTMVIFGLLAGLAALLYYVALWYLSSAVLVTIIVIFCVESAETIVLSRAEDRKIVGAKCLVIKRATPESRGIVRLFNSNGSLDQEAWSTEFSQIPVPTGSLARVTGMRSVILEISEEK